MDQNGKHINRAWRNSRSSMHIRCIETPPQRSLRSYLQDTNERNQHDLQNPAYTNNIEISFTSNSHHQNSPPLENFVACFLPLAQLPCITWFIEGKCKHIGRAYTCKPILVKKRSYLLSVGIMVDWLRTNNHETYNKLPVLKD
jgi:hypothetical protein